MEDFTLPLTDEEQAMILLWLRLLPHIKDTIDDNKKVWEAIRSVIPRFAEYMRGDE